MKNNIEIGEKYIFHRIEDKEEGKRRNLKTGRYKSSYVGESCIAVSDCEPYAMKFSDGTLWALSACELSTSYPDGDKTSTEEEAKKATSRKYIKCMCMETGVVYNSYREAALAVGATESNIKNACNSDLGKAVGYHWRKIMP